jgi:hypothetical protein
MMKRMVLIGAAALALGACSYEEAAADRGNVAANAEASAERPSEEESLAYIDRQDRAWAAMATKKNPDLLEQILADDYVGVGDDGTVRNKAQEIDYWAKLPLAASADPPKMNYRSFGDTVLAQGDQVMTLEAGGEPIRILWTDVWMYRDGQWQIVGSQNATVAGEG